MKKSCFFFSKNVSEPSNPPDELAQHVSKKSPSDELFLNFSFESSESDRVFNSNKGTGGMESSVVLFKPRIHLFACTLPSVSNSCDCNAL